jgi:2-polyprenyl-3-methyl-5-hydroxy-6-metoxy-1,4-benzoquinol methylase
MQNFRETTEESRRRWEINADCWDARMGDDSNSFHRTIVRPHTEQLLDIREGDLVLDIACGNGNFSQRLAEKGAHVVAFDYSENLIALAKRRWSAYPGTISFHICDATDGAQVLSLKQGRPFDKAVANMAVMDIADIEPLFRAVRDMLKPGGIFVFSTHHPCFVKPQDSYLTPCVHEGEAIQGQPVLQYYYHRSLQDIFQICFQAGFAIDGFYEEPDDDKEYPVIVIVRLRKQPEDLRSPS